MPMGAGLGTVERCGPHADKFSIGQRVVCIPSKAWSALDGSGTWQQAMLVPQDNLYPVPDSVPDQDAAQFAVGRMLRCSAGKFVLSPSACSVQVTCCI